MNDSQKDTAMSSYVYSGVNYPADSRGKIFENEGISGWARFLLGVISNPNSPISEKTIAFLSLTENMNVISDALQEDDFNALLDCCNVALKHAGAGGVWARTLMPDDTDAAEDLFEGQFVKRIIIPAAKGKKVQEEWGGVTLPAGRSYVLTNEYTYEGDSKSTLDIIDADSGKTLDTGELETGHNRFATFVLDVPAGGPDRTVRLRFTNTSSDHELSWYQSKVQSVKQDKDTVSMITAFQSELEKRRNPKKPSIFTPITGEPLSLVDVERLSGLRNKFAGERIFIMGNGPSLNKTPLDKLDNDYVFGLNRISLLFERVTWRPTFFTAFDVRVVPDNKEEFAALDIEYKFFSARYKEMMGEKPNHYWYHAKGFYDGFESCFEPYAPYSGFGGGGTIAIMAIQLAFFMGFKDIYLLGTDVSYSVPKTVKQSGDDVFGDGVKLNLESTKDDDANHFDPRYFGAGKKWHNPNVRDMKIGFARTASYIEQRGGRLLNATVGGELDQVQRVDINSLF